MPGHCCIDLDININFFPSANIIVLADTFQVSYMFAYDSLSDPSHLVTLVVYDSSYTVVDVSSHRLSVEPECALKHVFR